MRFSTILSAAVFSLGVSAAATPDVDKRQASARGTCQVGSNECTVNGVLRFSCRPSRCPYDGAGCTVISLGSSGRSVVC
nr:uncharacterized protein CTRU02_02635 [Colletotrichum truncatum]KAF6798661.1 hypothetical protein CTRU02_02635 [Colletotrichum truncatum]